MESTGATQPGSITRLLDLVRGGDEASAVKLYQRVLEEVLSYARQRIKQKGVRSEVYDEYDLVQDVLPNAIERLKQGKHADIRDRNGLWGHLFNAVQWEVNHELGRQLAQKRGRGQPIFSLTSGLEGDSSERLIDQLANLGDIPADIQSLLAWIEREYLRVNDRERPVLAMMLEGYKDGEIAEKLDCSVKIVEHTKRAIRNRLRKVMEQE